MVKYKKTFLSKIKLILSYFIEFSNDKSILLKVYPNDYIVKISNQKLLIIIINNESIFFINKSYWKI